MSLKNSRMQELKSFSDELENILDEVPTDFEEHEEKPKLISVPELVDEDETKLDNVLELSADFNDKVGVKRQRKNKDAFGKPKKKRHESVRNLQHSAEIEEMWDSITNTNKNYKNVANCAKKVEYDDEIDKLFKMRKTKSKEEKNAGEIAVQVEQVMATLEIAVEDDIVLNKDGKPAINKLMNLPLLNGALSKKQLQAEFLDHGVLNLLKNWLEPLPDGSLPNINIRTAVLNVLNDLFIDLGQYYRREQLIKSGLGKVIMFLSKSAEETTLNKKLANDIVNKWSRIIYNKSTRYEDMYTQEEHEKQQKLVLKNQIKKAPKVSKPKATDFNVDIDFSGKPKSKVEAGRVGRTKVPEAIFMDFKIRPKSKIDKEFDGRVKMQMKNSCVHERINSKLKQNKKKSQQAFKPSVDGRTMLKYL